MGLAQHNKWKYQCLWSCASGSSGLVTTSTKFGHYWKHISKCRNAANGGGVAHRMISVLHKDLAFLRQSGPPTISQLEEEGSVGRFKMERDLSI